MQGCLWVIKKNRLINECHGTWWVKLGFEYLGVGKSHVVSKSLAAHGGS